MNPLSFFLVLFKSAMLSTGGFGNVPILHHDFVRSHLISNEQFAESLAVGQVSPGPNGLWVISLGYIYGGMPDACLALIAITLPPLLVLVVKKIFDKHRHNRAVEGFMMGLEIAVIAIFFSVMIDFLKSSPANLFTGVTAMLAFGLALSNRIPVALLICSAAIAGWIFR